MSDNDVSVCSSTPTSSSYHGWSTQSDRACRWYSAI